jgi:hypothetical protein
MTDQSRLVVFVADDQMALWRRGDKAHDLGPESPGSPIHLLRMIHTGEMLALTLPFRRGLIEYVDDSDGTEGS